MTRKQRIPYYYVTAVMLLLCLFFYSGYQILSYYAEQWQRDREFAALVSQVQLPSDLSGDENPSQSAIGAAQLAAYRALWEKNNEMVGWIRLEDTAINFPVMQSPTRPNFYLRHNFEGAYSVYGTPYINEDCNLSDCDNITVYGHNMQNDRMFGHLERYQQQSYYAGHRFIRFDTLDELGVYEIFAVFQTTADTSAADFFPYHTFVKAKDPAEFQQYVDECRARAYYDTGIVPVYGDQLLALSTCEYSNDKSRLVVAARKCE